MRLRACTRLSLLSTLLFAAIGGAVASEAQDPRIRHTINEQWRFARESVERAEAPELDDSTWQRVNLPHTWNALDAFDENVTYHRGTGWYRKALTLDPKLQGRRLFLYFEGANQVADVYVNGRHAGQHVGGYTAFVFDITELAQFDRPNLIAVRVDNTHSQDIPPLNGDFTFYGGIYRDVWLIATSPTHVTVTDHASPGIFISTPAISESEAVVQIRGTINNHGARAARLRVVSRVLDAEGREVTSASTNLRVDPAESAPFEQRTATINNPRLWSPEDPYLFRVRTEVLECANERCSNPKSVDAVDNPLGFRWFTADSKNGFTLNGKPLKLFGTNRHQDYPGFGNAVPDAIHRRDVQLVKENGFNFLRLAHYPQDPAVLEETDRIGLAVWEEIPIVNLISTSAAFADHSEQMLVEMIRQHYNHPSILFWGYMNEVLLFKPDPLPEGYFEIVKQLTARLEKRTRQEDPTRLTVMALSHGEINDDHGIGDVPHVLGLNLYFGWYYHTFDTLGPFLDELYRRRPRPIIVSEYGADTDERVHAREPVAFDFSSEHGQNFHVATFPQLEARPYVLGTGVWNQFDFGSAGRQDTKYGLNQKGLYFYDRTPKDTVAYYRSALLDEPLVYIAREWPIRAGSRPEDRMQPLWVYSNQPEVELFVNGRSAGRQKVENRTARWMVELSHGTNRIRASSDATRDETSIEYSDRHSGRFFAVNAGGAYSYTDEAKVYWEADRPYQKGSWGHFGGDPVRTHHRIFATKEDALFQSSREGMERYQFDVPDGPYRVTLGVAEGTRNMASGARVFDVRVNGREVFRALDLARDFGEYTAAERSIMVEAVDGKGIIIEFTSRSGKASIASILVQP